MIYFIGKRNSFWYINCICGYQNVFPPIAYYYLPLCNDDYICSFCFWFFLSGDRAVLLWLLTAACIKTGRPQIARRAIDLAESRLLKDGWPEYYDGKSGRFIGKQARKFQTWSIAGYLVAKMMLEDPSHLGMISLEEDKQTKPVIKRSHSWTW